jgi:hypothetical protein
MKYNKKRIILLFLLQIVFLGIGRYLYSNERYIKNIEFVALLFISAYAIIFVFISIFFKTNENSNNIESDLLIKGKTHLSVNGLFDEIT